jgi:hypothetical protein
MKKLCDFCGKWETNTISYDEAYCIRILDHFYIDKLVKEICNNCLNNFIEIPKKSLDKF